MAEQDQGVNPSDSPADTQDVQANSSNATPDVSASSPDRSVENMFRELQRKQDEDRQQLRNVLAYLATAQQSQPSPRTAPASTGTPTDEDLWNLAQQGNREAFEEYQRRIARRELQQTQAATSRVNVVESQLQAVFARYPVLNDGSHPLTQKAAQAYRALLGHGYPNTRETQLEAYKTAIADSPDIISDLYSQGAGVREGVRRSATRTAQSAQTGATYRDDPAPTRQGNVRQVTGKEADLARRMGVKDPAGAKKRFLDRQASGASKLGQVGAHGIDTEGEGF